MLQVPSDQVKALLAVLMRALQQQQHQGVWPLAVATLIQLQEERMLDVAWQGEPGVFYCVRIAASHHRHTTMPHHQILYQKGRARDCECIFLGVVLSSLDARFPT